MADPYLAIGVFEAEFGRDLSAGERLTAERLLQVVSDWITAHAPEPVDGNAAKQVCFEVVRDAINYGQYRALKSFTNTTSRRTESGEFDEAMKAVDDYLTDRHRRLLGIAVRAAPRGHFVECDY